MITQLLTDQRAIIRSGDIYRDYIYVKEIGSIITKLINSEFNGPVNIGTGIPMKIMDIVNQIGSVMGKQELIQFTSGKHDPYKVVIANTEVLHTKLGYKTRADFGLALNETIEYWKSQLI